MIVKDSSWRRRFTRLRAKALRRVSAGALAKVDNSGAKGYIRGASTLASVALFAFVLGIILTVKFDGTTPSRAGSVDVPIKPERGALDLQESFHKVATEVGKAVVHITTKLKIRGQFIDPWGRMFEEFPFFFEEQPRRRARPREQEYEYEGGLGTGMVIRENGFILTNRHVIQPVLDAKAEGGTGEIVVQFPGEKKEYKAELKGHSNRPDLAVIKINLKGLPFIKFGDSDKVKVGAWAIAIGNPFGYDNTVTVGIVSAKYRELQTLEGPKLKNLIQTDAAINPGNSGGPLANIYGEVIGVNVAIASGGAAQSAGIGFAIPSNDVKIILEDLVKGTKLEEHRPWMGVSLTKVEEEGGMEKDGALVVDIVEESPADEAGLRRNDVIMTLNGKGIKSPNDLIDEIQKMKPGEIVTIKILRKGKEIKKEVTLAKAPERQRSSRFPGP